MSDDVRSTPLSSDVLERADPHICRRTLLQSASTMMVLPAFGFAFRGADAKTNPSENTRTLRVDQKYLLFPINNKSLSRRITLLTGGQILRSFTASLGLPADWWAHLDVSAWFGHTVTLTIGADRESPGTQALVSPGIGRSETTDAVLLAAIRTSSDIWSRETLYAERQRPAFHFSVGRGRSNDPHPVYYAGQYHLFFQHNPYGLRGGNTHWGHAISADLVHWRELPIALYPRGEDDFPFSGSGAVDNGNTSGWSKDGQPAIVLAFTSSGRGECIAYSQDQGATWTEYEDNPVIVHDGRDPKIFWHAPTRRWIMVVYSAPSTENVAAESHGVAIYSSPNLKSWDFRSRMEGFFECPDLFRLPVDGDPNNVKWIMTGAVGDYYIGDFDGFHFTPTSPRLPAPSSSISNAQEAAGMAIPLFYAAQTFNNHPRGLCVQIAWGRVAAEGEPFSQLMTIPVILSLQTTAEGLRLCREPVPEVHSLRQRTYEIARRPLTIEPLLTDLKGEAWDIEALISVGNVGTAIMIRVGADEYVYQPGSQMLIGPNCAMSIPLAEGRLRMRLLVDRTTVEIFGDRGQAYGLFLLTNPSRNVPLQLRSMSAWGDARVDELRVHSLGSAWSR